LHAQTLHSVCPVCAGEFLSALTGEFDELVVGSPPLELEVDEEVEDVVLDDPVVVVGALLSPGDCPGGRNGDCGALVM
jgi:hypothetical protein